MAEALAYKKNLRATAALELFYTGGPVVLSSDASFVACACTEDVKVVDVETGKVRCTLQGDSELVTALCLSPDGKFLVSASRSLQIRVWDLDSVSILRTWKAHDAPVTIMAMDPSGGLLATASADRSVLVWDLDGGFYTHAFRGHKGVVTSLLFDPAPKRLVLFSGGDDATVRVWDLVRKSCVIVLDKHFAVVTSLAISADGFYLVSAGRDKVVNVWDLGDYTLQTTIPVYEAVETVRVVPDDYILPGANVNTSAANGVSHGVVFLTVGELGVIRIWNSNGSVCLYNQKSSDAIKSPPKEDSKGGIIQATIMSGGRIMCVTADQCLLFYESVNGEDLKLYKRLIGYNEEIIDLKFVGEDANRLAVATNLEQVRVYDMQSMACVQELVGHTDIVLCLDSCITPSGQSLLASSAKDKMIRIWNLEDATCVGIAAGHMAAVGAVAFSKKKKDFFVSGSSDCTLKVWKTEGLLGGVDSPTMLSSQAAVKAHDKDINALAIAPNDSLVCSASQDRTARVWRLPELVPVVTLTGHKRGVWSVEFSPVDQCVLTGSGDKTIRIWALSDGSCLKAFEGHTASVLKVSFITRGTQIISAGADGLVKLWTIKSNECTNTFDNHEDKIWALAVSAKDKRIATGGSDSLVNLWEDCTAADEEEAFRKEEEEALKDQDLANALKDTDYVKAVQLAFELKRPFRLLHVFEEVFRAGGARSQMQTILQGLGREQIKLLLEYVRDWNSKTKFCHLAQRVLFHMFHIVPPTEMVEIPGIRELLEGILPYSQRHLSRVDRLNRSAFLLDFILSSMSSVVPDENRQFLGDKILGSWESLPPITTSDTAKSSLEDPTLEVEPEEISHVQVEPEEELDQGNGLDKEPKSLSAQRSKKKGKRSRTQDSEVTEVGVEIKVKKKKSQKLKVSIS
ncbi:unnamed protein product [Calypogeia fissa]